MISEGPQSCRQETLRLLKSKLRKAQADYSAATAKYWGIYESYRRNRLSPSRHAWPALSEAQRQESAALQEYMRVLSTISSFLLNGGPPPEI
jgi:hypothetical protein